MEGRKYCATQFCRECSYCRDFKILFLNVCICAQLCVVCAHERRCPRTPAEGLGSSGTGVTSDGEQPDMRARSWTPALCKRVSALTSEPSLQPVFVILKWGGGGGGV